MIHAYIYRTDPEPFKAAERVWQDSDSRREQRAAMMKSGALRKGDTLLISSLHNLAGSPRAYKRWQDDLREIGVEIRVVSDDKPARPVGRPRKYDPCPAQKRRHWAIWTDGHRTEADRLDAISLDYGERVTRQTLFGRYGGPSNPKPLAE